MYDMFSRYVRGLLSVEELLSQNGSILSTGRHAIGSGLHARIGIYARNSTIFAEASLEKVLVMLHGT